MTTFAELDAKLDQAISSAKALVEERDTLLAEVERLRGESDLMLSNFVKASQEIGEKLTTIETLRAKADRMEGALKSLKCGSCGGSGIYVNHSRSDGRTEVSCKVCSGTGQHPVAVAALKDNPHE